MVELYIILVYDIVFDEGGSRVLRKVFNICKKYLHHIQNSVFEGELSKSQLKYLKSELEFLIRSDRDSLIIFEQNSDKWIKKNFFGLKVDKTSNIL